MVCLNKEEKGKGGGRITINQKSTIFRKEILLSTFGGGGAGGESDGTFESGGEKSSRPLN